MELGGCIFDPPFSGYPTCRKVVSDADRVVGVDLMINSDLKALTHHHLPAEGRCCDGR
jgi:hypothetical protein